MKLNELLLGELEREAPASRRILERVPDGRYDWKPHEKSMPLGYLATLVATMPGWIDAMVNLDQLDFAPKEPSAYKPPELRTNRELLEAFDAALAKGHAALRATNDEHLRTTWKLLAGGEVVQEQPRYIAIGDGVLNHWAHHRGQLSVYLRLNDVPVPSIYGPTADEGIEQ
ncbi:MAG TPA: DinB family protein [Thermoanaerobaculia bacterium]